MKFKTVKIGNQEWMQTNLNTKKFLNGENIFYARTRGEWYSSIKNEQPAYSINKFYNSEVYYNYYALIDQRKILPTSFEIPAIEDVNLLIDFLGGKNIAGLKLKSTDNEMFEEIAYLEEDERELKKRLGNISGFSAVETGFKRLDGWYSIGMSANFWVLGVNQKPFCLKLLDGINEAIIIDSYEIKNQGFSVRGIKNT